MPAPTRTEIDKAYHETGHAVIARVLGIHVNLLTTFSIDEFTGAVAETYSAAYLARDADQATRVAACMKDAIVCLAGPEAQYRHRPQTRRRPPEWESDLDGARNFAATAALIASGVDVRAMDLQVPVTLNADQLSYANDMLQQSQEAARELVAEHWETIERIANVLLQRPILNGDDLNELDPLAEGKGQ
jgi:hypothetical protein